MVCVRDDFVGEISSNAHLHWFGARSIQLLRYGVVCQGPSPLFGKKCALCGVKEHALDCWQKMCVLPAIKRMFSIRLRGGCLSFSFGLIPLIKILLVGGNGKGQVQQFAYSRTARHLHRFAASTQPIIKPFDDRIVARSGERCPCDH